MQRLYNSLNHRIRYRTIKPILQKLALNFGYLFAPEIKDISTKNIPKIAFIKQDVYQDLYNCPHDSNAKDVLLSTFMRSGVIGLFTKFNTDFWIIKTEDDPECNIWKEKQDDCNQQPIEYYESFKEKHALYSKSADEIDWSQYDIVISTDISVPARITKKYPQVIWSYLIAENCMRSFSKSRIKPIDGYDLFLNLASRQFLFGQEIRHHEIEFPYHLQYYPCFHELFNIDPSTQKSDGIVLEYNWTKIITKEQIDKLTEFGPIRERSRELIKDRTYDENQELFLNLLNSKYFVMAESSRGLGGTGPIEAIASGCLFIGNPKYLVYKSLLTPLTIVNNFDELISKLEFFENNEDIYQRELQRQRKLLNYIGFYRPMKELFEKGNQILKRRNIDTAMK